jgi:hypothetical protein
MARWTKTFGRGTGQFATAFIDAFRQTCEGSDRFRQLTGKFRGMVESQQVYLSYQAMKSALSDAIDDFERNRQVNCFSSATGGRLTWDGSDLYVSFQRCGDSKCKVEVEHRRHGVDDDTLDLTDLGWDRDPDPAT